MIKFIFLYYLVISYNDIVQLSSIKNELYLILSLIAVPGLNIRGMVDVYNDNCLKLNDTYCHGPITCGQIIGSQYVNNSYTYYNPVDRNNCNLTINDYYHRISPYTLSQEYSYFTNIITTYQLVVLGQMIFLILLFVVNRFFKLKYIYCSVILIYILVRGYFIYILINYKLLYSDIDNDVLPLFIVSNNLLYILLFIIDLIIYAISLFLNNLVD